MAHKQVAKSQRIPSRNDPAVRPSPRPRSSGHPLAVLQRSIGNGAVQRMINSRYIQAKLSVSSPGDQFEQEADQVADKVMRMPDAANVVAPAVPTAHGGQARGNVESSFNHSKGRGRPLPDSVRKYMEPRFGVDFNHVNVHTGSDAVQMNRALGAQAFTHGSNIYYGAGHSPSDLELTAHELTHVEQQTGAQRLQAERTNVPGPSGVSPSVQRSSAGHIQRRLIVSGS